MAMVINTNIGSENAIRLLDKSGRSQATSMERLTSGQRINGARDDAAGLAVVTGMTAQIRGTDMAVRNANDGMALIQTVDGASEEVVNMLQRQRELAVQALNGTYTSANRAQMNTEFQQLSKEMDRIATTTKFNGVATMANMTPSGKITSGAQATNKLQIGWQTGGMSARNQLGVSQFNFNVTGNTRSGTLGNGNIFGVYTKISTNNIPAVTSATNAYAAQTISTQATASIAVMRIDSALSNIGTVRAKWGAMQNRLEYTVSNLQNVNENIMNARSRIQDTDYARESANLARTQVLQQAGMSMLSQANQMSQNVMSLLK
jgi:flagellin